MSKSAPWLWFAAWAVIGLLDALGLASMLTIGVFVAPIAAGLTVLMSLHKAARRYWPGVVSGMGAIPLVLAYLNRGGPGYICTTSATGGQCQQEWNPWIFLTVAVALIATGIGVQTSRSDRAHRR